MSRGRWLAAAALALYLAAVTVWVGYDRRSARETFPPGSIYATGDEGLSLAYSYLRLRGSRVAALRRRTEGEELPRNGVVLRVLPTVAPFLPQVEEGDDADGDTDGKDRKKDTDKDTDAKKSETKKKPAAPGKPKKAGAKPHAEETPAPPPPLLTAGEETWVRGGGRLVLALDSSYGPLEVETIEGKLIPVRKVFPLWPGVSEIRPTSHLALGGPALAGFHSVALTGAAPVIARETVGSGDVILLSCPEVFDNHHLGLGHHLALLEALAGGRAGRPVFFDERAHGLGDDAGVTGTLGAWGLGPLLLLALLATGAAFWRAAVRIGAPDREDRDTRSDAVELVDSLADLYDRALGRGDAIRLYHESFVHSVAAETGLRGAALEARARELVEQVDPFEPVPALSEATETSPKNDLPRDRFDRALRTLNEAFRRLQDAKRT
jgi:hypothetical protein